MNLLHFGIKPAPVGLEFSHRYSGHFRLEVVLKSYPHEATNASHPGKQEFHVVNYQVLSTSFDSGIHTLKMVHLPWYFKGQNKRLTQEWHRILKTSQDFFSSSLTKPQPQHAQPAQPPPPTCPTQPPPPC